MQQATTVSNKPKRAEWITDYYLQIAAYSLAHKEQYGPINQGLICVCTIDKLYQEFPISSEMLKDYEEIVLTGEVPSPINPPKGCHFHPRCPFAMDKCSVEVPEEKEISPGYKVSCHLY